ncbi:lysophospholipid acyltransferase family protein [Kibdelosporangium aridum]|uniref:1-acyl-sn-glycerol-3-phosphate acyltransferase n=1 Tax=Kibdelosporangium aridum TaxID=2030 RepID=A0A1Y5Y6G2_KIBAR|nr:lysophospholipid acyltransferase family protein [Kibdelosporangium aridum]SMD26438.1 1-acyl-sn-glycerol-3-phosphate acyltransferase [Kibdelosporangium aridum]
MILVSAIFWSVIVLTCPVFFAGAVLVWLVTAPFDRRRSALHLYTCAWAVCYVRLNPLWRLRTSGRELLPWHGGAILAANHASTFDIIVLFDLFRPFKWVSKAEMFRIPFIGWNMRLNGYMSLVRGDRASVRRVMARCDELLDAGSPVMFFPEGRRSEDGTLQPFKDGAFDLAIRHQVPLYPIAVHGTRKALPKHGFILRHNVDVRVEVLSPLSPTDFADVASLREETRRRIAAALAENGNAS